jgi:hypothetical protein
MRDPELVARAQCAASRLESAWERWRALQGLGETPAQPVVGYVGHALKEAWGQPRAVMGFSAEEAERLAEYLERGSADHGAGDHGAADHGAADHGAADHGAADRGLDRGRRYVPGRSLAQIFSVTPAIKPDILAVTSQLSGSQSGHSFLPGRGARLRNTRAGNSPCIRRLGSGRPGPGPSPDSYLRGVTPSRGEAARVRPLNLWRA